MNGGRKSRCAECQRGLTLVELMVSIVIGMVIVLFLTSLYINSRSSYRVGDDNSRMQQEGRAIMHLIGRNLMQAGFGNLRSSDMGALIAKADLTDFAGDPLLGCTGGFAQPTNFANSSCASAGTDRMAFQIGYRVDNAANTNIGSGTDCNGQAAAIKSDGNNFGATEDRYVLNRFYLDTTNRVLRCVGNGNAVAQPLLNNVDNMVVTYGITTKDAPDETTGFNSVERFVDAASVTDWGRVISVNVCLELSSPTDNVVTGNPQRYTNCNGAEVTAGDRRLHATISSVYALRNNASVRNTSIATP